MRGLFREMICFEITGGNAERFFNISNRRCLNVFNICNEAGRYYAFTALKDFPKLCAAAEKSGAELVIVSHYGLPYHLRNYRERLGFAAGFGLFCLTLWVLSLFIWSVETVNMPEEYAVSISDLLYQSGIRTGVLCSSVDCGLLELELEEKLPQFDMIKVSRMGSSARVQFSAARPVKKLVRHREPCNLIASESGQIVSVTASQGIPFVAEGDIVVPGDVLVSGVFSADGEYISMVHSAGEVTALVDRTFSESVDYRQIVTEPTGHIVNINRVMVFGMEIPLFGSLPKGCFSRTYEEYPLNVMGFSFPFVLRREIWHELCYTEKEFSREECIAQAEKSLAVRINKADHLEIVSSERTVNETGSGLRVTRYVTLLKEISEENPILVDQKAEDISP